MMSVRVCATILGHDTSRGMQPQMHSHMSQHQVLSGPSHYGAHCVRGTCPLALIIELEGNLLEDRSSHTIQWLPFMEGVGGWTLYLISIKFPLEDSPEKTTVQLRNCSGLLHHVCPQLLVHHCNDHYHTVRYTYVLLLKCSVIIPATVGRYVLTTTTQSDTHMYSCYR